MILRGVNCSLMLTLGVKEPLFLIFGGHKSGVTPADCIEANMLFKPFLEDASPFCVATNTPVLDLW